jgi:hypothetical protein
MKCELIDTALLSLTRNASTRQTPRDGAEKNGQNGIKSVYSDFYKMIGIIYLISYMLHCNLFICKSS